MGVFELLSDDHALLTSQVRRAVALLRVHVEAGLEESSSELEATRQLDMLSDQLIEHFEFEENTLFPELEVQFPEQSSQFGVFRKHHEQILRALQSLQDHASQDSRRRTASTSILLMTAFEAAFYGHVSSEMGLFKELAAQLANR
jgi:iron-sulfur cluster repair protein YtfE (RIC family)